MITPELDFIIVIEEKKGIKSSLFSVDGKPLLGELVPFKIVSIGPGYWQNGVFIKTTHKPGDLVIILSGITQCKYKGAEIFFAKERDVLFNLIED